MNSIPITATIVTLFPVRLKDFSLQCHFWKQICQIGKIGGLRVLCHWSANFYTFEEKCGSALFIKWQEKMLRNWNTLWRNTHLDFNVHKNWIENCQKVVSKIDHLRDARNFQQIVSKIDHNIVIKISTKLLHFGGEMWIVQTALPHFNDYLSN